MNVEGEATADWHGGEPQGRERNEVEYKPTMGMVRPVAH